MSHTPRPETEPDQPLLYEVRIKGHLGDRWDDWFDHMTVTPHPNGETTLTGAIVDQAALHGVLTKVRDLGLQLLSVTRIEPLNAASGEKRGIQPSDSRAGSQPRPGHLNGNDRKEST